MRGASQSTAAAPDAGCFGTVANLLRQKPRELFRDRRVSCVRQAQFLKTNAPTCRQFTAGDVGEESLDQNLVEVFTSQLCLDRASNELRALAQQRDWAALRLGRREQFFLCRAALMRQAVQLPGVDAVTGSFKALLQNTRQRQIHVVSTEQYVVANSN